MVRIFNGTNANNSFVGDLFDINIFNTIGIGTDRAIGGVRGDIFNMRVDGNADFVDGGLGRDTINYAASTAALTINLSAGVATAGNVTVTQIRNVEDVVGSRFNDTIIGSTADNRLDGGGGNDIIRAGAGNDTLTGGVGNNVLDGGTGSDTVDYSSAGHSVLVFMSEGVGGETDFETGDMFTQDSLTSIENMTGSRFDDLLIGTSADNVINGGSGNDSLKGMGGNDTIHGGLGDDYLQVGNDTVTGSARLFGDDGEDSLNGGIGNDTLDGGADNDYLFGSRGNDTLIGGDGNDHLEGSVGADAMDGGAGVNALVYRFSQQGVTVNLANQTANGGDATGDTFTNVQNVWGTQIGNDTLIGSSGDNAFFEQGGNNTLVGNGGSDTFAFGATLTGTNMVMDYAVGDDRLAFVGVDGMEDLNFTQTLAGTLVTYDDFSGSVLLLGVNTQDLLANAATDIMFTDLDTVFMR